MFLTKHLAAKELAAGLFRPVAETASCFSSGTQLHTSLLKGLRGVLFGLSWRLQLHGPKDGCYPRRLNGRWVIVTCRGPQCMGKPLLSCVRSLGRDLKAQDYLVTQTKSRIDCFQFGIPWALDPERTSGMLTN